MEREEYDRIYRHETTHFWYRALRALVVSALRRHASQRPLDILDAGCGTGGLMTELAPLGRVTGLDLSADAVRYAAARGHRRLLRGDVMRLPFKNAAFDVVVSTDVLYHRAVLDDRAALLELARLVKPGGVLLLSLAAYEWLRSHHDRVVHTARRYSRRRVRELVRGCDLTLTHLTYTNALLLPPAVLTRLFARPKETRSDLRASSGLLNSVLTFWLKLEGEIALRVPLPMGLSLFAILRR